MNTTTYEVLPIGNLDFSDIGLKDLCFDKDSITAGYNSEAQAFLVSAKLKMIAQKQLYSESVFTDGRVPCSFTT